MQSYIFKFDVTGPDQDTAVETLTEMFQQLIDDGPVNDVQIETFWIKQYPHRDHI